MIFLLPEITRGDVYFVNNDWLCYHDTILWKDIKFNPEYKVRFTSTNSSKTASQLCKYCFYLFWLTLTFVWSIFNVYIVIIVHRYFVWIWESEEPHDFCSLVLYTGKYMYRNCINSINFFFRPPMCSRMF